MEQICGFPAYDGWVLSFWCPMQALPKEKKASPTTLFSTTRSFADWWSERMLCHVSSLHADRTSSTSPALIWCLATSHWLSWRTVTIHLFDVATLQSDFAATACLPRKIQDPKKGSQRTLFHQGGGSEGISVARAFCLARPRSAGEAAGKHQLAGSRAHSCHLL